MFLNASRLASAVVLFGLCFYCSDPIPSQEPPPNNNSELIAPPGDIPKGIEVQARGPIHEAFASPTTEPKAPPPIPKRPPTPLEEMPPEDRPEGDVVWIGGYYAWDDDRADFLWVSGCWRIKPANKEWVPGYWREVGTQWQWAPGFWTSVQQGQTQPVTYFPDPPAPPNIAPPGDAPAADTFYVPGYWMWNGGRYAWRAGYWTRVRPGYVYVPSHYRWTPQGYVFVGGYWDLAISRRGVLYAPIVVNASVVPAGYVYTPYYAVRDTMVLDTMFIRPATGYYYFGDYYGPRYVAFGFQPAVVYSRRHYEPIFVYERWNYRSNPRWLDAQVSLSFERNAGRAPLPPRVVNVTNVTNVTNITRVNNVNNMIAPTRTVMAAQGVKTAPMSTTARAQLRQTTQAAHQSLAAARSQSERASASSGALTKPHVSSLSVPSTSPATHGGVSGATSQGAHTQPGTGTRPAVGNPAHNPATPGVTHPGTQKGPTALPKRGHDERKKKG